MIAAACTRSLTDRMEPSEGLDRGSIPLECTIGVCYFLSK